MGTPTLEESTYPKEWEQGSAQILTAIQHFIDGLRSAPCLQAWPPPKSNEEKSGGHDSGSLLMHFCSLGVMQQVQELQPQQHQWGSSKNPSDSLTSESSPALCSLLQNHYEADERKQILYQLVFPLLRKLEQCYQVLDNLPQAHQLQSTNETPSRTQSQLKASGNRRGKRAAPPPGMLSLNDYTNVACFFEFAISISLVPRLEYPTVYLLSLPPPFANNQNISSDIQLHKINSYTAHMAQKRKQTLPKSLAGRISRMALTWGTLRSAENSDSLHDQLSAFRLQDENTIKLHTIYHIYSTYQAYNEMTLLATAVGRLLLLDRFRPMLLPRHLSDVYLTLLIAERLRWYLSKFDKHVPHVMESDLLEKQMKNERAVEKENCLRLHSLQRALLLSPLMFPSLLISKVDAPSPSHKSIDCREAALAYRSLLGGGASMTFTGTSNPVIPQWLRLRLGQCLTKLAHKDLQSVVEVFVTFAISPGSIDQNDSNSTNDDVMTGAAARLAHALCAKPTGALNPNPSGSSFDPSHEQLCCHFVEFLVAEGERFMSELTRKEWNELVPSRSSTAMYLTLWATIAQLPIETTHSLFITKLISGLLPSGGNDSLVSQSHPLPAIQSTAAITAFFFSAPSFFDPLAKRRVQYFLFASCKPLEGHYLTMLGQVLRLAASFSHGKKRTAESRLVAEVDMKIKERDTVLASLLEMSMTQMVHILVTTGDSETISGHYRFATLAVNLLKAVSANDFDKDGYCFEYHEATNKSIACVRRTENTSNADLPYLIEGIQDRAECLVKALLSLYALVGETSHGQGDDSSGQLLVNTLFWLVLLLHFSTVNMMNNNCSGEEEDALTSIESSLEVWGCEELSKSNSHEIKIAATILLALLCENFSPSSLLSTSQSDNESDTGVLKILGLIINSAAARVQGTNMFHADGKNSEELYSTTSIVLSLLIALLELGVEKRSEPDELFFKTMLPSLHVLSGGVMNDNFKTAGEPMTMSELAEMASHAMALIAARDKTTVQNADVLRKPIVTAEKSKWETIVEKLSQAESELQSSQPPLRAKGVVSLRHVARSMTHDKGTVSNRNPSLVNISPFQRERTEALTIEMEEDVSTQEGLALISRTLARIALKALGDSESYIYLAAIQTLVAVSDVCPAEIMPLMGIVIMNGELDIVVAMSDSSVASVKLTTTPEQRIKATEALIFIIRRRGDNILRHGPSLLDTMLFGMKEDQGEKIANVCNDGIAELMVRQTHSYFMGDTSNGVDGNENNEIDEKEIRLHTGGPVFSMEENDVLRAGAILVVCELVSVLAPSIVAQYCHILVGLATYALQLEASRPVRRAGANLARELYACTLKEVTAEIGVNIECMSTMAIAMVDAKEERLYSVLSRCVLADELAVNEKTRLSDPATQARSEEAIGTRLELQVLGVLQAAAAVACLLEQESKDPKTQAVRKALSR